MEFWTALPIRDALYICVRDETGTTPVRPIPSPDGGNVEPDALTSVTVNERGVAAAFSGKQLHVIRHDEETPRAVELPDDLQSIHSIHFVGDVLYIGGRSSWQDTSRLGWVDINAPQPMWHALPPPSVVGDPAQPVHAIFSIGTKLIALDGAYTPKLALVYDITKRREPTYVEYVSIPSGIDDKPVGAALGRTYAAILTTSHQDSGKAWRIGIFDANTLDEIATFYQHAEWSETIEMPCDIMIRDDLLLVAQEMKGLGTVRLDDGKATRFERTASIRPWVQSYLQPDRIEYQPSLGQGRVIAVRPTQDPFTYYVILQRGSRTWWEEVTVR